MSTWPTSLPAPNLSGYQLTPNAQTIRTDMEVGAARVRRRSHARLDKIRVSWIFTDAQMDTFRTWFEDDTEAAGGSAWFSIDLRIGNTGATAQEARFVGEYQAVLQKASIWSVSAEIEVR